MDFDRLISSPGVRIATAIFAVLCGATIFQRGGTGGSDPLLSVLAIGTGIAALVGLIFSFRPIYAMWMKFAGVLHTIATTILFGAFYLLVVPLILVFVRISDPLRMGRSAAKDETFWIPRHSDENTPESFQRMG